MKYTNIVEGVFVARPNRFIAKVLVEGREETVHVKNTGRCRELLVPGCRVFLEKSDNLSRKTAYDLIAVGKERENAPPLLINMDSQAPNKAAEEWVRGGLFSPDAAVRREVKYGNSRFDLFVRDGDREAFVEVKGVTLEQDGVAMFPDAPTERGVKHIHELIAAKNDGYGAYILFVIQMKGISLFTPNYATHREFGEALREAQRAGVNIIAADCIITPDSMNIDAFVRIEL